MLQEAIDSLIDISKNTVEHLAQAFKKKKSVRHLGKRSFRQKLRKTSRLFWSFSMFQARVVTNQCGLPKMALDF